MERKNKKLGRRKYDADFQAEVLKMVSTGQTAAYVSKALGVGENLIYRWKQEATAEKGRG